MDRGEEAKKEDPQGPSGAEGPQSPPAGSETELPPAEAEDPRRDGPRADSGEPDGPAPEDGEEDPQGACPGVGGEARREAPEPTVHLIALRIPRKWRAHFLRRGLRPFPGEGPGPVEERQGSPPPPPPPPPSPRSSRRSRVAPAPRRKRVGTCGLCRPGPRAPRRQPAGGPSDGKGRGPAGGDPFRRLVALVEAAALCRCSLCLVGLRFRLAQLLARQVLRCRVAGHRRAESLRQFREVCARLGGGRRGRGIALALRLAWAFRYPGSRAAGRRGPRGPPEASPPVPAKPGGPRLVLALKLRVPQGRWAHSCPSCRGRAFSGRARYRDHLRARHTWGVLVSRHGSDRKPFLCPRCGQGFRFFCQLVCHRCNSCRK